MEHDATQPVPRYAGPIWCLLILAPFIAEVLSGSTRFSYLFVLIPEIMVWGVGALLCRELVRRWRGGGASLLLLGLALSIAEEFLIQQTSLAPLPFPGANTGYGRYWGVNWLYFLFMLGFESVWVVVIPVQVVELYFPQRSRQAWLRRRGLVVSCVVFCFGSFIAWYSWTQQALPKKLHVPPYHPPVQTIALGVAAIVLLIASAYRLRGYALPGGNSVRVPVHPVLAGVIAFIMGGAWFALLTLIFVQNTGVPVWMPLVGGVIWSVIASVILLHWSVASRWGSVHRWAAIFGATLASMVVPYLTLAGWSRIDLVGVIVFDALALTGFILLGRVIGRRSATNLEPLH
jgi:hypothetical protein